MSTSTATVTSIASAQSASSAFKVKRRMYDLAEVFPEVRLLSRLPDSKRTLPGYDAPFSRVPRVIPGFKQEWIFMEKALAFLRNPNSFVINTFGPTGCGKSERWRDLFGRLNRPLIEYCCTQRTESRQLIGGETLKSNDGVSEIGYVYGLILTGMKHGIPVLLNEAFRLDPQITSDLHTIADTGTYLVPETGEEIVAITGFKPGETVPSRPGFKLILTANQSGYGEITGAYAGDQPQDFAWLNRHDAICCTYLDSASETAVIQDYLNSLNPLFGTDDNLKTYAGHMVNVANQVRSISLSNPNADRAADLVEISLSIRELKRWAYYFNEFTGNPGEHALYKGLDLCCLSKATPSTRQTIEGFIQTEFGIERGTPVLDDDDATTSL